MISHHPLVGVGVNTFTRNYLKYKLPEPENAKTSDAIYAHNNFLHMAGEIGLLGLGCFLWILFNLFKTGIWLYQNLKEEYLKIVAISLIACFIAFLINGLTETSLYYSRVAMIFWYLIGLSLALIKFSDGHKTGTN
jgi:putative inorganic carbon (HCO3(-)) transporter